MATSHSHRATMIDGGFTLVAPRRPGAAVRRNNKHRINEHRGSGSSSSSSSTVSEKAEAEEDDHSSFRYQQNQFQKSSRGHRKKSRQPPPPPVDIASEVAQFKQRIASSKFATVVQDAMQVIVKHLHDAICDDDNNKHHHHQIDIVCYGIGSMSNTKISQQQLALLLQLMDYVGNDQLGTIFVYDPVLTEADKKCLTETYKFSIIPENEHCRRSVSKRTLFYMPHCGKQFYSNLLLSNWTADGISRIAIIGNSFSNYLTRLTSTQIEMQAPFVRKVSQYLREVELDKDLDWDADFFAAFNDLSAHMVLPNIITEPAKFWMITDAEKEGWKEDPELQ